MVCILCTLLHYLALYWSFLVHLAPSCTIFHYLALSCTIWPLSTLSPAPSHSWNSWMGGGNIQILSYYTLQLISTKQWANCISKAKQHKIEPWHHCLGLMPTANKKSWNTQTLSGMSGLQSSLNVLVPRCTTRGKPKSGQCLSWTQPSMVTPLDIA